MEPGGNEDQALSSSPGAQLREIRPEWSHALKAGWLISWRTWGIVALAGFAASWLLGEAGAQSLVWPVFFVTSFVAVRMMLGKKYGGFRIAVLLRSSRAEKEEPAPGFDRALSIWWLITWRSSVIYAILYFPLNLLFAALVLAFGEEILGGLVVLAGVAFLLLAWPVTIWTVKMSFSKKYATFRLAIVEA